MDSIVTGFAERIAACIFHHAHLLVSLYQQNQILSQPYDFAHRFALNAPSTKSSTILSNTAFRDIDPSMRCIVGPVSPLKISLAFARLV